MKEHVSFDKDYFKKYIATLWGEENVSPEIFSGIGNTEEEALKAAREKYEKRERHE